MVVFLVNGVAPYSSREQRPRRSVARRTTTEVDAANERMKSPSAPAEHEGCLAQLAEARARVGALTREDVLRFHAYLERQLSCRGNGVQVRDATVQLIQGLSFACDVAVACPPTRRSLLKAIDTLFSHPGRFLEVLVGLPPMSAELSYELAPHLMSVLDWWPSLDPNIDACYTALHSWLLAFYEASAVSDDMPLGSAIVESHAGDARVAFPPACEPPKTAQRVGVCPKQARRQSALQASSRRREKLLATMLQELDGHMAALSRGRLSPAC